jgi:hypothetical protein
MIDNDVVWKVNPMPTHTCTGCEKDFELPDITYRAGKLATGEFIEGFFCADCSSKLEFEKLPGHYEITGVTKGIEITYKGKA